ncbi:MAG: hypothetical protein EBZ69_00360 [Alphaproteobacteria bacterium]|nr:hypothetical protein [Alphaproteobacteria bacterium]
MRALSAYPAPSMALKCYVTLVATTAAADTRRQGDDVKRYTPDSRNSFAGAANNAASYAAGSAAGAGVTAFVDNAIASTRTYVLPRCNHRDAISVTRSCRGNSRGRGVVVH